MNMLSLSKVANEVIYTLGTLFVSIFHEKVSSTSVHQWKYNEVFELCHYIRIAKSVKTLKMVHFGGCLKPTMNEFEYFFGLKYQRLW